MLEIKNVSIGAFAVALRWARVKHWPKQIKDWTPLHSQRLQDIATEVDRRRDKREARRCGLNVVSIGHN